MIKRQGTLDQVKLRFLSHAYIIYLEVYNSFHHVNVIIILRIFSMKFDADTVILIPHPSSPTLSAAKSSYQHTHFKEMV